MFSPARLVPPSSLDAGRLASTPAALPARQLRVLAHATVRELVWTLPAVAGEVRAWRALARTIPDGPIRHDALSALARKRGHTDGAALFCILTRRHDLGLLRLLVAYELLWDFLDSVNEHGAERGQTNGRQLHLALIEALDHALPISDYYRYHPWREDGGYLKALVAACRYESARLPSYKAVRSLLAREAWRAQVLGINHELDPVVRDWTLRRWASQEWPDLVDTHWWELTGAASASLTVHALLALAAKRQVDAKEIHRVYRAYGPWISAATTMLDSYVDQAEDAQNGDHSYVAHYPTGDAALRRVGELVRRATHEASLLPDAERHHLIVAAMSAMYLSKDSARTPEMRKQTSALIQAGGPLARVLLPVLRLWRLLYQQRSN